MKKTKRVITGQGYKVLFSDEAYSALHSLIRTKSYSSIFFLVDTNTEQTTHNTTATDNVLVIVSLLDMSQPPPFNIGLNHKVIDHWRK